MAGATARAYTGRVFPMCRDRGKFTRVGFLCDLALQADGKVYESTLLFWLPWGLRKEMLQKTYPCKTGGSVDEGRGPGACPLWEFHLVRRDKGCCGADMGA